MRRRESFERAVLGRHRGRASIAAARAAVLGASRVASSMPGRSCGITVAIAGLRQRRAALRTERRRLLAGGRPRRSWDRRRCWTRDRSSVRGDESSEQRLSLRAMRRSQRPSGQGPEARPRARRTRAAATSRASAATLFSVCCTRKATASDRIPAVDAAWRRSAATKHGRRTRAGATTFARSVVAEHEDAEQDARAERPAQTRRKIARPSTNAIAMNSALMTAFGTMPKHGPSAMPRPRRNCRFGARGVTRRIAEQHRHEAKTDSPSSVTPTPTATPIEQSRPTCGSTELARDHARPGDEQMRREPPHIGFEGDVQEPDDPGVEQRDAEKREELSELGLERGVVARAENPGRATRRRW